MVSAGRYASSLAIALAVFFFWVGDPWVWVNCPLSGRNLVTILRRPYTHWSNQSFRPHPIGTGATTKDPGVHILLYENIFLE